MIDTKYTYAVARIRALETSLLNSAVIEQLMACQTDVQCLQLLQEKGWGDADTPENAEAILCVLTVDVEAGVDVVVDSPCVVDGSLGVGVVDTA